jgi:hypothetical protein
MFNDLRRAVIVRFVDIGDNGDHQNLNCFYHTLIRKTKKENQRIYYDISEPWNIGHYSFSENDTSKCMVDIL